MKVKNKNIMQVGIINNTVILYSNNQEYFELINTNLNKYFIEQNQLTRTQSKKTTKVIFSCSPLLNEQEHRKNINKQLILNCGHIAIEDYKVLNDKEVFK